MAAFAAMFTSFRLNMLWVTMVSLVYLGISLTAGEGLDLRPGTKRRCWREWRSCMPSLPR